MILSYLSSEQLEAEAAESRYPKWRSICLLRFLHLPTLDAVFISPRLGAEHLADKAREFARQLGTSEIMVRSDGGEESESYYRGGKTLELDSAIIEGEQLIAQNRAVIFVEPTNRFENLFCVNITIEHDGSWVAEALGPGFDTSDLQRGLVAPKWMITGVHLDHRDYVKIGLADINIVELLDQTDEARVKARLKSVADLLGMPGETENERLAQSRAYFRRRNYSRLFGTTLAVDKRSVIRTINDCQSVFHYYKADAMAFPLTVAAAVIWDRRFVYWDITYGKMKWKTSSKESYLKRSC